MVRIVAERDRKIFCVLKIRGESFPSTAGGDTAKLG